MKISGHFNNLFNDDYYVEILNEKSLDNDIQIIDNGDVKFADDPVNIQTNCDDSFTHIIKTTATINLLAKKYLGDYLFTGNEQDIKVNIFKGDKLIFAGFIEPCTYSQEYDDVYNSFSLSCLDYLGILQYKYVANDTDYDFKKSKAGLRSFREMFDEMGISSTNMVIDEEPYEAIVHFKDSIAREKINETFGNGNDVTYQTLSVINNTEQLFDSSEVEYFPELNNFSTLTELGTSTFMECSKLKEVWMNDNLTSIAEYAFNGCTSLEEITLPKNISTIADYAFEGCTKLKNVWCQMSTAPTIGVQTFEPEVKIRVPWEYLDAYKTKNPDYASQMDGCYVYEIPTYQATRNIITNIWYDQSIQPVITSSDGTVIKAMPTKQTFYRFGLNLLNYFGEDKTDVENYETILNDMLMYLNLHMIQFGNDYYVFNWYTKKTGEDITWINVLNNGQEKFTESNIININEYTTNYSNYQTDMNITINDVYNRIELTCNVKDYEQVITSPINQKDCDNVYSGSTKFASMYVSEGRGNVARDAFNNLCVDNKVTPRKDGLKTYMREYYIRLKKNDKWKITYKGKDVYDELDPKLNTSANQWNVLDKLKNNVCYPAIFSIGKTADTNVKDNNRPTFTEGEYYIVISTCGNGLDYRSDSSTKNYVEESGLGTYTINDYASPTDDDLKNATYDSSGNIFTGFEYISNEEGIYSPQAGAGTNYLQFDGTLFLNPVTGYSGEASYFDNDQRMKHFSMVEQDHINDTPSRNLCYFKRKVTWKDTTNGWAKQGSSTWRDIYPTIPNSSDTKYGGYFGVHFYKNNFFGDQGTDNGYDDGWLLDPIYSNEAMKQLQYNVNYTWEDTKGVDTLYKVPILECELSIGGKYCVETFSKDGQSQFNWYYEENLPLVSDGNGGTYRKRTFSLGINPKDQDQIIGVENNLQRNIVNDKNMNVTGTLIPMNYSDKLQGKLKFRILGPINTTWNDVIRRHSTWFRHTKFKDNDVSILARTSAIWIKNLTCKLINNNTTANGNANYDDLKYYSDLKTDFCKKKDDITFNIFTALTWKEAQEHNVKNTIAKNNVFDPINHDPVLYVQSNIYENEQGVKGHIAKPEQFYVDQYYQEFKDPRVEVEVKIKPDGLWQDKYFSLFTCDSISKSNDKQERKFNILNYNMNLYSGMSTINIKETEF